MDFGFLDFLVLNIFLNIFIYFHRLNDELGKHKEKILLLLLLLFAKHITTNITITYNIALLHR